MISNEKIDYRSRGNMRNLSYKVMMSFPKQLDDDITFFTIETSLIGGNDFIKPSEGSVVQEWDKYVYTDYTWRVKSIEWNRQTESLASVSMATADIVFDNHDDYFTPSGSSEIGQYILPYRPIRIYAGFGDEIVPVFVGITEKMPVIDEKNKTASFHCVDFMYSLMNTPLDESAMYESYRSDEVLAGLFELAGMTSSQFDFNEGMNIIPFAYFQKGTVLKDAVLKVAEAEQGRIYMDEYGVIKFLNRADYDDEIVYSFNAYHNINEIQTRTQDDIVNVVSIHGDVRTVQPNQPFWQLFLDSSDVNKYRISANDTAVIWVSFIDPVTDADTPVTSASATTSYFKANDAYDGSGIEYTSGISVTGVDILADTMKLTFSNTNPIPMYIYEMVIYATPAPVTQSIYVREEDETSVSEYDQRVLNIENNFFQNMTDAQSMALVILHDHAELEGVSSLSVKGSPLLQIDDTIEVNVYGVVGTYKITKIQNKMSIPARYTQILSVKNFTRETYFTIGVSEIGGTDAIRP